MKLLLSSILAVFVSASVFGQCDSNCCLNGKINADLVSRYVWRGQEYYNSPAIQPNFSIACKNFSFGAWGSFSLANSPIQETHTFLAYKYKMFQVTVWDYYFMNYSQWGNKYLNYNKDDTTGHDLSVDFAFLGTEKLPLKILAAVNFYGADTCNSMYFEADYTFGPKAYPINVFVGFTPTEGWYGNGAGIVNCGLGLTHEYKINEDLAFPVYGKLILNPQRENIYLVFGITF
jgi:hypothetical protein